ncbi:MAG: D-alanine--D-alanine ligase family protein [Candidatus Saccharicenans sp.]|nr:D-alanine--D-alanine ligase family protein [Candidatus Saccharicenans sp.]MDI6849974.1 D-alanine--D-alanine ligase family protein [Candidatus Saccharicenans sp.]
MKNRLTVALIFGGRSAEHEISIISARAIYKNLDRKKYRVISIFVTKKGNWKLVSSPEIPAGRSGAGGGFSFLPWDGRRVKPPIKADVYFPVLHGPYGEDGTIQGLLEMADVPYVGAPVLASAIGMDKAIFKHLLSRLGLPVVPYLVLYEEDWRANRKQIERKIFQELCLPVFVKPANLGSSVGISKVKTIRDLAPAVRLAFRYDHKILVEKAIKGREIECSVLGNERPRASLPGEVIPHREFYDYSDKYLEGKTEFHIPAELPAGLVGRFRELAVASFRAIDGCGMARVDFFLEQKTNKIYINEINTIPGFTEISMYPRLWEASGLSFSRLLDRLIQLALRRHRLKKRCLERS